MKDNIVQVGGRIYVPPEPHLREEILEQHHTAPTAGHSGVFRTLELIEQTYWWPSIMNDVKRYVKGCESCQRNKINWSIRKHTPLRPNEVPKQPWEIIGINMIGPLPKTRNGHDIIVVIVDCLTKAIHLIPTTIELTVEALAKLYRDMIWKLHGLPKKIISDCGPQFTAKFMKSLCNSLEITRNLSTAYHPQTDGQTEHSHQETEAFLTSS